MEKTNVTRSSMPPFEEYCQEIRDLWDSVWLTNMGAKHQQLQTGLARYLGVENLELVTNGHMAIELSLQAMELRGEVITTPFTFASTTQAIVRNGLTPVFCDIDPVTFTIDPAQIEALLTERTSAIVPVHVYGNVCQVEEIERIAKKHHLKVPYDAAHAFGVRYKGKGVASYGDGACFSFHATKVFHTVEGGAACFREEAVERRLAMLRNFGLNGPESAEVFGVNAKLDEFRAAMGLCSLRHVDRELRKRRRAAERYRERLEGTPGLQLNPVQPEVEPNYAYFPVVFDGAVFGADRDQVMEALVARGIVPRKYFYPLTSALACYRGRFDPGRTPVAERICRQVLCLPLYADLEEETVDRVCEILLSCRR